MHTLQTLSGRKSLRMNDRRLPWLFGGLGLLTLCLFVLSCLLGVAEVDFAAAWGALIKGDVTDPSYRILFYIRLPRALGAILAGGALAVAGVLIQAVLQNPMAAPNVIGVNAGAGLATTLMLVFLPTLPGLLPLAAFFGALGACLFIYAIASRTSAGNLTVTLVGIAVGSVLSAGINGIKVLFPDSIYDAERYMIGSLSGLSLSELAPAAPVILVGLLIAALLSRRADLLTLGGEAAGSLGLNVSRSRFLLLVLASALAGAAVSFAGLLGFVGLLIPHILRRFVGSRHKILIPAAALGGGSLVLLCDLFSRVLIPPYELPVGILLSLVGGVFFLCLVLFGKRGEGL